MKKYISVLAIILPLPVYQADICPPEIISIVARQLQNAVCNKVLTSTIRFHDCFDQIFRHIGVVGQQLLGVFRQAVTAARCQVLDNFFHK